MYLEKCIDKLGEEELMDVKVGKFNVSLIKGKMSHLCYRRQNFLCN